MQTFKITYRGQNCESSWEYSDQWEAMAEFKALMATLQENLPDDLRFFSDWPEPLKPEAMVKLYKGREMEVVTVVILTTINH